MGIQFSAAVERNANKRINQYIKEKAIELLNVLKALKYIPTIV
jgi:hypothetical protein